MRVVSRSLAFLIGLASILGLSAEASAQFPPLPPMPPTPPGVVVEATIPAPPIPQVEIVAEAPPPPAVEVGSEVAVEGGVEVVAAPTAPRTRLEYQSELIFPLRLMFELQLGWSMMDPATDGHTGAFGLGFDLDFTDWFALGLHGHATFRNQLTPDLDLDGFADADSIQITTLSATLGPRFRLLMNDDSRDQLGLEAGVGVLWIPEETRPWGAMIDVALFGGIDMRGPDDGSNGGFLLYPMIRYQQGLADAGSYRAVLVGLAGGVDIDASPHRGDRGPSGPHFTFGVDGALGGGFLRQGTIHEGFAADLGLHLGLVIEEVFEPLVRVDFMHRVIGAEGDGLDVYGLAGGFRLLFDPWAPVYVEALTGWAVLNGTAAAQVQGGLFVDAGAGLRWIDCGSSDLAIVLGARARIGVLDDDALSAIFAVFGLELDGGPRPDRPRCHEPPPAALTIAAPPPPTEYVPIAREAVVEVPQVEARVEAPRVEARVEAQAELEVQVPSEPAWVPLSIEPSFLLGFGESDRDMSGVLTGFSLALGFAPVDEFMLLVRGTILGGDDGVIDVAPRDFSDDDPTRGPMAYLAGGDLRLRVFTDQAERNGWTFELGGGYLALDGLPRPGRSIQWQHGGYAEAAIGHQRGVRFADGGAVQFGLSLRYQQGLGDTIDYRAVLLTGSMMFEGDTPASERTMRPADFQYTLGLHIDGGLSFYRYSSEGFLGTAGFGVHFGLPIGRWFEPRIQTDLHFIDNGGPEDKSTSPLLSFLGVLRLRLDEVFPLYIDAGAGYATHWDIAALSSPGTAFVDFGVGARFTDCSVSVDGALELGAHVRIGVEDTRIDDALFFTLGLEYDGGAPMFGPNERAHCQESPPSAPAEPRRTATPPSPSYELDVPAPPSGGVIIDVTAPAPPSGTIIIQPPAPPSGSVTIQPPAPPSGTIVVQPPAPPSPPRRGPSVVVSPEASGTVVVQPPARP